MSTINSVTLIGRLGQDPEIRHTSDGSTVANFRIAVDNGYGEQKTTSWIRIVAWKKTAEAIEQYVHKGSLVGISGRLQERKYEKDGDTRSVIEVIADRVQFLDSKPQNEASTARRTSAVGPGTARAIVEDEEDVF